MQRHQTLSAMVRGIDTAAFKDKGLRKKVFGKALKAFERAFMQGRSDESVVTVIDYELHSKNKRLWVIDLQTKKLLFHEYVSHGKGSDPNHDGMMDSASNTPDTNQSNVGLLRTGETYSGKHGNSLRLDGLEAGFNDNARSRGIVVHSASYVDDKAIHRAGKSGRSRGCPALDPDVTGQVIETIKDGNLVFAYYPDENWLRRSAYLNH